MAETQEREVFAQISALAQDSGLVAAGAPATPAIEKFAQLVAHSCLDMLENEACDLVESAFDAIDDILGAEENDLVSELAQEAGLIGEGVAASPAMEFFAQLVVENCLQLMDQAESAGEIMYAHHAITSMFGDESSFRPKAEGWFCTVRLHNATLLNRSQRHQAENAFYQAVFQRFSSLQAAAAAYENWIADMDSAKGQEWVAARLIGHVAVHRALAQEGGPSVPLSGSDPAYFEMNFMRDG
ncbi:hypothetical protein [Rhodoferax sp.]|uniref:hypothetical protein n=1 Tax=Rhodoferax sp. TaxID=50421 RepID=UPI00374D9506